MLKRSSSSPVRTGPLKGLNGPPPPAPPALDEEPDCHGFPPPPPLVLRDIVGGGVLLEFEFKFEFEEAAAVIDSADVGVGREEVAAEYESLENMLSNPLPPLPAPTESEETLAHSNPPLPGLPPLATLPTPPLKLGLDPILGGGGNAWMREYPAARPWGRLWPGAWDWRARVEGERVVWGFRWGMVPVVVVVLLVEGWEMRLWWYAMSEEGSWRV
jgi:hypothetical protein